RFDQWRRRCRWLGPSSTVRTLLESAAAPLVEALGFERPCRLEQIDSRFVRATLGTGSRTVTLVVGPWGERLDPLWRIGVTHAVREGAPWCLLFNGTHLRILDAGRLYSRRYIEFDLDLTVDDDRTFPAFWWIARAERFTVPRDHPDAFHTLVAASERHASGVCRSLKDGVLAASTDVFGGLTGRG